MGVVSNAFETQSRTENDLLTEARARAEELPMSLAWYRRKRLTGGGPAFVRVGSRVFYRRAELRRFVDRRAVSEAQ